MRYNDIRSTLTSPYGVQYTDPSVRLRSGRTATTFVCLALAFALAFTTSVSPMRPSEASAKPSSKLQAIRLITEGQRRLAVSDFKGAIKAWRQAYTFSADRKLLYYIAVTYGRLPDACVKESQAWNAYIELCKSLDCDSARAKQRYQLFKKRCYAEVKFTSPTQGALVDWRGKLHPLPFQIHVLRQDYAPVKVSAPQHVSRWVKLELTTLKRTRQADVYTLNIDTKLVFLPEATLLKRHQTKILLGSAIAGILFTSFGALQLNGAREVRDQMDADLVGINYFTSVEEQERLNYSSRLADFESKQAWGVGLITLGIASLGVSVWSLFIKDPNQALIDKARRQGDLNASVELTPQHEMVNRSTASRAHSQFSVAPMTRGASVGWLFTF